MSIDWLSTMFKRVWVGINYFRGRGTKMEDSLGISNIVPMPPRKLSPAEELLEAIRQEVGQMFDLIPEVVLIEYFEALEKGDESKRAAILESVPNSRQEEVEKLLAFVDDLFELRRRRSNR